MTTPGETLGNTSGETSGSQQPQVERGAVLSRIADGLANLGVLKQAGVTDPGADPIAPPIASSEQPIGSTDTMGGPETAEGAIGVPDPTGRHESNFDPKQLMALLLEQNAALAEQNRLAAKKQRKEAKRERAETAAHQATMEAAAREQVEAATATHGALEGLTAEQKEANRLAAEQLEANRLAAEVAEATYHLQYEVNAPELHRRAAAQRAAEQAAQEAAERLEARPQWVKDLEADLTAEPDPKQHGRITMDALLDLAEEVAPHVDELISGNTGPKSFNYRIGQQEEQVQVKKMFGRTKWKTVTKDVKKELVYVFKGRVAHVQDPRSEGCPFYRAIAIDPENGQLYSCTNGTACLLEEGEFNEVVVATGANKPKLPEQYLTIAQKAMGELFKIRAVARDGTRTVTVEGRRPTPQEIDEARSTDEDEGDDI